MYRKSHVDCGRFSYDLWAFGTVLLSTNLPVDFVGFNLCSFPLCFLLCTVTFTTGVNTLFPLGCIWLILFHYLLMECLKSVLGQYAISECHPPLSLTSPWLPPTIHELCIRCPRLLVFTFRFILSTCPFTANRGFYSISWPWEMSSVSQLSWV